MNKDMRSLRKLAKSTQKNENTDPGNTVSDEKYLRLSEEFRLKIDELEAKLSKSEAENEDLKRHASDLEAKNAELTNKHTILEEREKELKSRVKSLEEDVAWLKLPKDARRRQQHRQQRERAQNAKKIEDILKNQHFQDDPTEYTVPPSRRNGRESTGSSTPGRVEEPVFGSKYLEKYDFVDKSLYVPTDTIKFREGEFVKAQPLHRCSTGHINSIKEQIMEENKENMSDPEPEIGTPSFRLLEINSDENDSDESEEDLSDSAFEKRHAKLEIAERKMVQKDKIAQQQQKKQRLEEKANEEKFPYPPHLYSFNEIHEIAIEKEKPALTVFGAELPAYEQNSFSLPWIISQQQLHKARQAKRKSASYGAL